MTRLHLLSCILALSFSTTWALAEDSTVPPDLTKTIVFSRNAEYFLGPTGAKGWMYVNPRYKTDEARQILITSVQEGSAADGTLRVGDVLLGIGEKRFDYDARKSLGVAIDEAQKTESRGVLKLLRWRPVNQTGDRKGSEQVVDVILPVLGTYADTAPHDCPKTNKMLDDALKVLIEREDWSKFGLKALALLSTGEKKYHRLVHDYLHEQRWAQPEYEMSVERGGLVAWGAGYQNLVLTEYYLATGDKFVLPAIREHAVKTAMGQSNGGTWGHGFAWTSQNNGKLHGSLGGYGELNQAGLPCFVSLLLSKRCGIEHPEIDDAIHRSERFFQKFVGHGSIGYGFHRPSLEIYCNGRNGMSGNGKNGIAAVAYSIQGNKRAGQFFSKLTVSLYKTCEYGHSGNSYSFLWDPLGANAGGPAAAAEFHKKMRWYYALTRQADGSYVNQPLGGFYGRGVLDATVAHVLMMTSSRRAIHLTGKEQGKRLWLSDAEATDAVGSGKWRFPDTDEMSAEDLIGQLDDWSPIAREWIAKALAKKQGDFAPELLKLLKRDKPEARAGACAALGHLGARASTSVDEVSKALSDKHDIVQIAAGYALARLGAPGGKALPDLLRATLVAQQEGLMNPTQQALSYSLGYAPGRVAPLYFSGVLPNLSKQGDPLKDVDRELLYAAVTNLLKDPSGRVRGCGAYPLKFFKREDLAVLAQPIYDAIVTPAPAYAMFVDDPRQHGIDLFVRLHISEGVSLSLNTIEPKRWGQGMRLPHRFRTFETYGGAAKSVLPQLQQMRWTLRTSGDRPQLEAAIRAIESGKSPAVLVSLHTLVDERFAADLASAKDDPQRVKLCRELMKTHPDDYFYQAAGLRKLASLLRENVWDDIRTATSHDNQVLRNAAIKVGAQLPGQGVTRKWLDELVEADPDRVATALKVLTLRGEMKTLAAVRRYLASENDGVRSAAMQAVTALGGKNDVLLMIDTLTTIPTDAPTANDDEQRVVGMCRRVGNVEQASAHIRKSLPDAPSAKKATLLRMLGQLGGAPSVAALTEFATDEDAVVRQASFDALADSADSHATEALFDLLTKLSATKHKNSVFQACLKRVVIGRTLPSLRESLLRRMLAVDEQGRNGAGALYELQWSPSVDTLRLAQSYLTKKGLTETAATTAVAIAQKLELNNTKQRMVAIEVLREVVKVTTKETTLEEANAFLAKHEQ